MQLHTFERMLLGQPLPTAQARHERLSKAAGLAIFASDNLSSVAYASEEILRVLIIAGTGALALSFPIGVAIAVVIGIVMLDYIDHLTAQPGKHVVTLVLPEFIPARWWQHLLHNQTALLIKGALLFRKNVIVTDVPYHLKH